MVLQSVQLGEKGRNSLAQGSKKIHEHPQPVPITASAVFARQGVAHHQQYRHTTGVSYSGSRNTRSEPFCCYVASPVRQRAGKGGDPVPSLSRVAPVTVLSYDCPVRSTVGIKTKMKDPMSRSERGKCEAWGEGGGGGGRKEEKKNYLPCTRVDIHLYVSV